MSESTNALLQQAYRLIENDERVKAQEILAPLLEEDADNAHLWWVYAHAVQDSAIGQAALERVLQLDPQYPGASELKSDVLEAQALDPDLVAFEANEPSGDGEATPLDIDDWEDLQPVADVAEEGSASRAPLILIALLLIAVAAGAFVISGAVDLNALLSEILPPSQPRVIVVSEATSAPTVVDIELEAGAALEMTPAADEATQEADELAPPPTASATVEAEATATAEPEATPTVSPGSARIRSFVSLVSDEVEDFAIDPLKSGMLQTRLGATLLLRLCAIPGPEFNQRLNQALTAVVSLIDDLPDEIEAVAAGLINCEDADAPLRIIGVARADVVAFANDEIDDKDFQRAWQPLS